MLDATFGRVSRPLKCHFTAGAEYINSKEKMQVFERKNWTHLKIPAYLVVAACVIRA